MHRTEGDNHSSNLFTDGPPGATVEENWLNAVQEEICNVITAASITLKTAASETRDQLLTALQALFIEKTENIGKNVIINGDMRIAQRGASGGATFTAASTPANSDDTYLIDQWLLLSDGNDIVDVSQNAAAPDGFLVSCALDVETINKKFGILHPIEQKNCQHLVGETVSLSFWAKVSDAAKLDNIKAAILSWNGVADTITSDVISAWNAEDTNPTFAANWTAENTPSNLGVTAVWTKFSIQNINIDTANTKNLAVFIWNDGFCDTLETFLYITGVQLEKGSVASEYQWNSISKELIDCWRYYFKSYDLDVIPGTADDDGNVYLSLSGIANSDHAIYVNAIFPITMRVAPTVTTYDGAGTSGKVTMAAGDNLAATVADIGFTRARVTGTNGAASTIRLIAFHYTAEAIL